jgi:hypothetical protein
MRTLPALLFALAACSSASTTSAPTAPPPDPAPTAVETATPARADGLATIEAPEGFTVTADGFARGDARILVAGEPSTPPLADGDACRGAADAHVNALLPGLHGEGAEFERQGHTTNDVHPTSALACRNAGIIRGRGQQLVIISSIIELGAVRAKVVCSYDRDDNDANAACRAVIASVAAAE